MSQRSFTRGAKRPAHQSHIKNAEPMTLFFGFYRNVKGGAKSWSAEDPLYEVKRQVGLRRKVAITLPKINF